MANRPRRNCHKSQKLATSLTEVRKNKTNSELYIQPYKQGIQLLDVPQKTSSELKIAEFMQLPFPIYFLNSHAEAQSINSETLIQYGIQNEQDALGKSIEHFATTHSAQVAIKNTEKVLFEEKSMFFDEEIHHKNGSYFQSLALKAPCYDSKSKLIGVLGFSIAIGKQSLAASITTLNTLGFLHPLRTLASEKMCLSKREKECLHFYLKGKTAKEIGRLLNLSYRTIENYLQKIKIKMGVQNKAELIAKTLSFIDMP